MRARFSFFLALIILPLTSLALTVKAVKMIDDQQALYAIATSQETDKIREAAIEQLTDQTLLVAIATANEENFTLGLIALEKITDETLLIKVAKNASNSSVRSKAILRLTHEETLLALLSQDHDCEIRGNALMRYLEIASNISPTLLVNFIQREPASSTRYLAVQALTDRAALLKVAATDSSRVVRAAALSRLGYVSTWTKEAVNALKDESLCIAFAMSYESPELRRIAIRKITSQTVLAEFAKADDDPNVCEEAIMWLRDKDCIIDVLKHAHHENIRVQAAWRCDVYETDMLLDVAQNDPAWSVRCEALKRISPITDKQQQTLEAIYHREPIGAVRDVAILNITNPKLREKAALSDPSLLTRQTALETIENIDVLEQAALHDPNSDIRHGLIKHAPLREACLMALVHPSQDEDIRVAAIYRLKPSPMLKEMALTEASLWVRVAALSHFKDEPWAQKSLINIASTTLNDDIHKDAIASITYQPYLVECLQRDKTNTWIKVIALRNIQDESVLKTFIDTTDDLFLQTEAIEHLTDQTLLTALATTHPSLDVRYQAAMKLEAKSFAESIFLKIATESSNEELQQKAINKLTVQAHLTPFLHPDQPLAIRNAALLNLEDPTLLSQLAKEDPNESLRMLAQIQLEWYLEHPSQTTECPFVDCIFCP